MKEVNLKSISLVNFKGHKDLTISLEKQTIISGRNKAGKSTVFDSFTWMLFGKDQFDRKDYEIIPIVDNKKLDRVDSSVTSIISIEGTETKLQRVLHQKWVRKRGTAEEIFDGCETLYYINDVPKKAGEYKAFVETIADESVFKMITNPTAFLSLHWTKQREFLFQIVGSVSDQDIASTNPVFASLLNLLNGKSLIDFKKELNARKKKLKEDLDNIQPRIDQTAKLMPNEKDFEKIKFDLDRAEGFIKDIDFKIADQAAAIRGQYDAIQASQKQINDLRTKQNEIYNTATTQAQKVAFTKNQERSEIENNLISFNRSLTSETENINHEISNITSLKASLELKENQVVKLRLEWSDINSQEIKFNDKDFHCPTCERVFDSMDLDSKKILLSENFKNDKAHQLSVLNTNGIAIVGHIALLKEKIIASDKVHSDYILMSDNSKKSILELTERLKGVKEVGTEIIVAAELVEWQVIESEIKEIEAVTIEVKPVDNSDVNYKKTELSAVRDSLLKDLSEKDLIERYKTEIKSLEKKGSELAQQIADAEKQEFNIDNFNRVKILECERRVNGLFAIVNFQLFDKTNEGNEFETCIPTNKKGVTIAATNTAEKINAGIDIINTLSSFYNVSAPIFIDSAESVNRFIDTEAQTIHLVVTEEEILTIK